MAATLPPVHYAAGREILVIYAEEVEWHTRLLIMIGTPAQMTAVTGEAHHGGPVWWICTNQHDIYPEEIAITPSILGLRGLDLDGSAIRAAQVGSTRYLRQVLVFTPPRPAERLVMVAAVKGACASGANSGVQSGAGGVAVAAAETGLENLSDGDPDPKVEEELDARVLSIERGAQGQRHREFRSTSGELSETEWAGWPLTGPRTTRWVVGYIAATDGNPRRAHAMEA